MKVTKTSLLALALFSIVVLGCLDPYDPPTTKTQTDFVVIDGHINSTDNTIRVKITRSISLQNTSEYPAVSGATVFALDENNQSLLLTEAVPGIYTASHSFDSNLQYRLKATINGKEYSSDWVELVSNAPIDSLTWKADDIGLEVFANTQDVSEGDKYYRYSYDETFEYTSIYYSSWVYTPSFPVYRNEAEQIYSCWITKPSTAIIITSTENFTQNQVANFPLARIPKGDRRLWNRHSMLVKQYSLDKKTYVYWSQLQKITESLGSLFDPLPYQIKGNLHVESDPDEVVIGYFSGGAVSEKRIVIRNNELPKDYYGVRATDCVERYVSNAELPTLQSKDVLLTRPEYMAIFIIGFYYSTPVCVDCRLEGGTNVRPDFMN